MQITYTPMAPREAALTRAESARLLGVGRRHIDALVNNGWTTTGVSDIAALAERQFVTSDSDLTIVRLGAPDYDTDGRRTGVDPNFTDAALLESARQWWNGPIERALHSGHMLILTSTFIIGLLALDSIEDTIYPSPTLKRSAFNARLLARVDDLVTSQTRVLEDHPLVETLGHRIKPIQATPLTVIEP